MRYVCTLLIPASLLLFPFVSSAVEWTLHGSLKNETAYFTSGEARLDKMQNHLNLKPEAVLTSRLEFRGSFLSWYDTAIDIEPTNSTDLTPAIKQHYRTYAKVKEAYILYGGDDFDLRVGQQQIVWGKTDGLRLLDIVNPLDFREFILDDFLDSRIGLVAARMNYYTYLNGREHEFECVVIPDARVAEIAPIGSRWSYPLSIPPAGVNPVIQPENKPNWSSGNTEYGVAWRSNIGGWDLSLNWFYGWKDLPNMQKELSGEVVYITPVYSRMHTVGGSFSNAFGALVLRGELAVNIGEAINSKGSTPAASIVTATTWNAAFGLDYNSSNWRISPQIFIRHLQDWDSAVVEAENSGFVSLIISTDYLNEKLKPEFIGLLNWEDGSWVVRPKLSYELSDQIMVRGGADILIGEQSTFFGVFDDNDRIYSEVEYTF